MHLYPTHITMPHLTAAPADLLNAFLTTTTQDIIPLTAAGVASGCKVFGAAILRKSDLSLVVAATNTETESPLLHGEITCIQKFYSLPADQRPPPGDCVFFATHEPCSLCEFQGTRAKD
jgi:tRNA(Arg) A34 adenosine deaminase TadA